MKAKKTAAKKRPMYKAEGGDITSARTFGESQKYVPKQFEQNGGVAGAVNRFVQKATQPKAKVAEMERKAKKAKSQL